MTLAPLPAEVYVEGTTDVPIIRSLLEAAQWQVDASGIQVARGVKNIRKRMSSHAQASTTRASSSSTATTIARKNYVSRWRD